MSNLSNQYIIAQEEHNYNKTYKEGTIVKHIINNITTAYVAKQNVPRFVSILDEHYWRKINSTGGYNTIDYTDLINKPTINNVVISDDISSSDLGIADITKVIDIRDEVIIIKADDNTIYNCNNATSIDVIIGEIDINYISQINFNSLDTPTQFNTNNIIYFEGDSIDYKGAFVPDSMTRYVVMFYTDGTNILGIVRGTPIVFEP